MKLKQGAIEIVSGPGAFKFEVWAEGEKVITFIFSRHTSKKGLDITARYKLASETAWRDSNCCYFKDMVQSMFLLAQKTTKI
jgi:hypothetical protein